MKRMFNTGMLVALASFLVALLAGCGGGSSNNVKPGEPAGNVKISFQWPSNYGSASRIIPNGTQSMRVTVHKTDNARPDLVEIVNHDDPSVTTAQITFRSLFIGEYTITAEAFSEFDAGGTKLAFASSTITVTDGANLTVDLTLNPDVSSILYGINTDWVMNKTLTNTYDISNIRGYYESDPEPFGIDPNNCQFSLTYTGSSTVVPSNVASISIVPASGGTPAFARVTVPKYTTTPPVSGVKNIDLKITYSGVSLTKVCTLTVSTR